MTPKEANKILEMFLHKQCDLKRTEFAYDQSEVWLAVKTAKDALEKQIPKKPIVEELVDFDVWVGTEWFCPTCKDEYGVSLNQPHCEICGQKIDWE